MNKKDRAEFEQYLVNCTDAQVRGVFLKEHEAGRMDYRDLARKEAVRRRLDWARLPIFMIDN